MVVPTFGSLDEIFKMCRVSGEKSWVKVSKKFPERKKALIFAVAFQERHIWCGSSVGRAQD
jgi:hypothetical protein